jgi:hypothetical protein
MRINELFTRGAVPWKWNRNNVGLAIADFVVKGEAYEFYAESDDYHASDWLVMFQAVSKDRDRYRLTGTGNAATVMATVVDIMREFLKTHKTVRTINFSAEEPSRQSLYTKMIRRLLPSWVLTIGDHAGEFTLTDPAKPEPE